MSRPETDVCMLTTGFPRFEGDLFGSFILELGRRLVADGVTVSVVAPHAAGLPRCERFAGVLVNRFRYFLPSRWQQVAYGGGIPANMSRLSVRLQIPAFLLGFWCAGMRRTRRAAVVHCHWTISGFVAYWATRLSRRPLVLSVRGSDIMRLEKGLMGWVNRRTYRWMDRIIAVSEDIAERLRAAGVDGEKIRVVYNGVDERFQPRDRSQMRRRLSLPQDRLQILFVGLLAPVKGLDILIEALRLVGDGEADCLLVGTGPLEEQLRRAAAAAGIAERVRFVGPQPSGEIPAWLNAADLLVLPSLSEGRPNVVVEAQACGLPVLATRVGGTPELIEHGETGLLVESGDPEALAAGLSRLLCDAGLRQRLGRLGRERLAAQGLTWEASAVRIRAIYDELLEVR